MSSCGRLRFVSFCLGNCDPSGGLVALGNRENQRIIVKLEQWPKNREILGSDLLPLYIGMGGILGINQDYRSVRQPAEQVSATCATKGEALS